MIDTAILTQIGQLFADLTRFRFQLSRTDWFGEQVLWLAPQDPAPFRALTQLVYQAFPAFPPFEGRHDDLVPHLTVGHGHPLSDLRAAEQTVQSHLPIDAQATAVTLMTQQSTGGQWTRAATFTLG
jgi:2'-5' RNA ligase